jgi:hypothetical protein
MAWNQTVSGNLLECKMLPAVGDAWCRQPAHCNRPRAFTSP